MLDILSILFYPILSSLTFFLNRHLYYSVLCITFV